MKTLAASTADYAVFSNSSVGSKSKKNINTGSAGAFFQYTSSAIGDTILLPQIIVEATGNVLEVMTSRITIPEETAPVLNELDLEIALMSDQEVLNAVLAFEGAWADRDDLDDIMNRRDRIDELYASDDPNNII